MLLCLLKDLISCLLCMCLKCINFFLSRVILGDGYKIHIIVLDSQPYVSSGEISQLIWNNKEPDYLITRVRLDLFSIFTEIAKLYLYIFIFLR